MDRDVHRAHVLRLDAVPILFRQVRQRDKRAIEHGVPVVVIHHVQRAPHALGNLLDETERACVLADTDPIECGIGEGDAPEFVTLELKLVP